MNQQFIKSRDKYRQYNGQIDQIVDELKTNPRIGHLLRATSLKGIREEHISSNILLLFSICEECEEARGDELTPYCRDCPDDLQNKVYLHAIIPHKELDRMRK